MKARANCTHSAFSFTTIMMCPYPSFCTVAMTCKIGKFGVLCVHICIYTGVPIIFRTGACALQAVTRITWTFYYTRQQGTNTRAIYNQSKTLDTLQRVRQTQLFESWCIKNYFIWNNFWYIMIDRSAVGSELAPLTAAEIMSRSCNNIWFKLARPQIIFTKNAYFVAHTSLIMLPNCSYMLPPRYTCKLASCPNLEVMGSRAHICKPCHWVCPP